MEAQPPSNRNAINMTLASLLGLFAIFMMTICHPGMVLLFSLVITVICEISMIALTIREWSIFLKAYIIYEIEKRIH